MESRHRGGHLRLLCIVATLLIGYAQSIPINYCSEQNTAVTGRQYWQYQSNGWCSDTCQGQGYVVAITQGQYCWCSNEAPLEQASKSKCDFSCPGFPSEQCGSSDDQYWSYVLIDGATPSGTQSPYDSQPTKSPLPAQPADPNPYHHHHHHQQQTTPLAETSSSSIPTKIRTSTKSYTSSFTTSQTTVSKVTISGSVVTNTVVQTSVVPAAAPASTSSADDDEDVSSSTPTAAIAGGVVGGVGGLALIVAGVLYWLWRQRRNQREPSQYDGSENGTSAGVTRNTSVLSKTGLLGTSEKGSLPPIYTASGRRSNHGLDMDSISPVSERRNSRPLFYDQRLNPSALMDHDNGSRASISTMQDNRDYTRTLNIRNPDPEPDDGPFEPDHNVEARTR